MTPDTKPPKLSPKKQEKLDNRLMQEALDGRTETVRTLLVAGADVHAQNDGALRWAALAGHTETVQTLLAAGADAQAEDDWALRRAAYWGHTETLRLLVKHIFAPESWRGKSRTEIEAQATALYDRIKADNPQPECLHMAGSILADYALTCWEQVRPPPPPGFKISPLPAQPRPL
jgi:hypothetical protein